MHGPFFFGAAARLGAALDQIVEQQRAFVVDFTDVPFIDSSGARSFELLAHKMARKDETLYLIGARPEVAKVLHKAGVTEAGARLLPGIASVERDLHKRS